MLLQTSDSQVLHWRATMARKDVEGVKAVTSLLENGFVGWNRWGAESSYACILWSFLAVPPIARKKRNLSWIPLQGSDTLLCFPGFNFQSTWSHRHCSYPMLWVVTVAWLYIKPFRDVSSKEPTGDPVDSDPDVLTAEAALSEPTVLSHKDFAILCEILTVFTHLACSKKCIEPIFLENSKNGWKITLLGFSLPTSRKKKKKAKVVR